LKAFRQASTTVSGSQYPTLSLTLLAFLKLIDDTNKVMGRTEVKKNATLTYALECCKAKLEEYYDKTTMESELYYFASSESPYVFRRFNFTK